jgi:hypothetical protein
MVDLVFEQFFQESSGIAGHDAEICGGNPKDVKSPSHIDPVSSGIGSGGRGMALLVGNEAGNLVGNINRRIEGQCGDGTRRIGLSIHELSRPANPGRVNGATSS